MKNKIKLFISDVDGVWTDGGMFYDKTGNEFKMFNTADSGGILFLSLLKIPVIIITGENSEVVGRRMKRLRINEYYLGVKNKLTIVEEIIKKHGFSWNEVAYIGDDIADIKVFEKVGLSAVPNQAAYYIKKRVDWVMNKNGGEGAFREFVEKYLDEQGLLEDVIEKYLALN